METLARYLEDTDLFQGIQIGQEMVRLALFVDDVILFLSDPVAHISGVPARGL